MLKISYRTSLTLIMLLSAMISYAQDIDKNNKLNAIIKLSYINNTKLINTYSVLGQGSFINVVDPGRSFAASINPKNSQEFFAHRADELQNTVIQYVKHKIQHKPKFKHNPNLGLLHFAFIGVNPDVIK